MRSPVFTSAVAVAILLAATIQLSGSLALAEPAGHLAPGHQAPGHRAPGHRASVAAAHDTVIGHGTPSGCTSAAVVRAVATGGQIRFDCGPDPVTIVMKKTAKVVNTSKLVSLDGGGLVTLSGGGKRQILYLNTCDPKQTYTTPHCNDQRWPRLVVHNLTFADGNATITQKQGEKQGVGSYGGGAIFDRGGQLEVSHSTFRHNRCHRVGPDLGGGAIRALEQWKSRPVLITHSAFRGGRCSNGSALSSIGVSWTVRNSLMVNNDAVGSGANPASHGKPGGGSGGAIYLDGNTFTLKLVGTTIRDNHANEGGGAIFFVSNDGTGDLTITNSTLRHNPSDGFETAGLPGIFFQSPGHTPKVTHSTIK